MGGDSLLADPTYSYAMAVSINAPPEDIWPWLVQIGYQRGIKQRAEAARRYRFCLARVVTYKS